ncbi:MAG: radical SAM protein [Candidatus Omnitrophica bacterium]|nr:radical SAM protein [Candidatus Omnitrophota bacterium]
MLPLRNLPRFFYKALRQPSYALKVFLVRLRAYLVYTFIYSGWSAFPEALTFFLTYRCNLRCKMCGQWGDKAVTRQEENQTLNISLPLAIYENLINEISKYARPSITLFGGEPLLYPDCIRLIQIIKEKNMHCLLITNGWLLTSLAEELVKSGLDELNISLDGDSQLHDQIRGLPGLFNRIIQGIEKINYYKKLLNKNKPFINLQCTITQYNCQHLEEMLSVAERIKANSLTFHNLIFLDKDVLEKQKRIDELLNNSSLSWQGFVFEPSIDPKELIKKKKEVFFKALKKDFSVDFYPNFSDEELIDYYCSVKFQPPVANRRCLSPWLVGYIFPDGEFRPCLNYSYSFGNITKDNFWQIWNGQAARRFRILLKKEKIFPACCRCTELYRY